MSSPASRPRRVLVLYNTDYDAELTETHKVDVSEVKAAAIAVHRAVAESGFDSELAGVEGRDLDGLIARLRRDPPDLVFNLCESLAGDTRNELVVPAVLDLLRIPYTGPSALTIALCLHKDRCKEILAYHGVASPPQVVLRSRAELDDPSDPLGLAGLDYPYFLKLAREDASIGIEASNRVESAGALRARARELFAAHDQPILAERYVDGREVNVSVLGQGASARVLPLFEIDFSKMPADRPRVLTYAAKWDEAHVDYEGTKPVPMRDASPELVRAIEHTALAAFAALGMRDFGRVDLRVDRAGRPFVIDVNPNCDLSPDAGFARTAAAAGFAYHEIVGHICELAWKRHVDPRPTAQPG